MMSFIIMRAPQLKIRVVFSWSIVTDALFLMKLGKVKSDHQCLSKLLFNIILSFILSTFSCVVIGSIDNELLRGTFWLSNNVLDENW